MSSGSLEEANKASTIAVYGIGDGFYFDALQEWLKVSPHHQIVFFVSKQAHLETDIAKSIKNHPQAHIALLHDKEAYAILTPDFYFLSHEKVDEIYPQVLQDVYSVHAYLAEIWLYKEQANIYFHLAHLDEYSPSKNLEGYFANSNFTICGAGPSLEAHLDLLKDQKGILIGAGTAMNILTEFGIQPNLGVAFDGKLTGSRRLQSNSAFSTPFLVDLDSTEGIRYLSGSKILTKQGNLAPWKDYLLSKLGIKDSLMEVGPAISSTHYAIESALKLGASDIRLIGVDLAYVKGQQYAGMKTWLLDEDDPISIKNRRDLIVLDESHSASRIFLKEKEIISSLALKYSENHLRDGLKDLNKQPKFDIPLPVIQKTLLEWKEDLLHEPGLLLEGYLNRLELKFAVKKRFMDPTDIENEIRQFCKKVVDHHLHCLNEALIWIKEKIDLPDADRPKDETELDGIVKLYYGNGQLKSWIEYANGKRDGAYRFYSRSGLLLEEGHYKKGFPMGLYRQWNQKGYLEKEISSHPKGMFDLTEWDATGKIIKEIKSGHLFMNEVATLKESLDGLLKELP